MCIFRRWILRGGGIVLCHRAQGDKERESCKRDERNCQTQTPLCEPKNNPRACTRGESDEKWNKVIARKFLQVEREGQRAEQLHREPTRQEKERAERNAADDKPNQRGAFARAIKLKCAQHDQCERKSKESERKEVYQNAVPTAERRASVTRPTSICTVDFHFLRGTS